MLSIKYDTMLVIVYIWRILESPFAIIDRKRYDPVILSCRVIHSSCISFIFHTKLTLWIRTLLCIFRCCDRFRIFLWFGEIDRDINISIWTIYFPFHIFFDAVSSDIVGILAEFIEKLCCFLWTLFVIGTEFFDDLAWFWCQDSH